MNLWAFTGNIGTVQAMRFTSKNDAILGFSVAVTSGYGESKNTTWANCTLFGKRAESVAPFIIKGGQIGITGELNNREYDSQGVKKMSLDVRVNDVTLLSGVGRGEKSEQAYPNEPAKEKKHDFGGDGGFDDMDSDINF